MTFSSGEAGIVSGVLDFGIRGLKRITQLHIGADIGADDVIEVALDYKGEKDGDFIRTPFTVVNHEGVAWIRVVGVDFRVIVKFSNFEFVLVDYVQVMFQVIDRRYRRGINASQTNQTNG